MLSLNKHKILSQFLLSKLTPYVEEIIGDYQFKFLPNKLLFITFPHLPHWVWSGEWHQLRVQFLKTLMHEGNKCDLMSCNGCCHSSYRLLSEDVSMTVHSVSMTVHSASITVNIVSMSVHSVSMTVHSIKSCVLFMWVWKFVSSVTSRT
jgi:hypothetical protein